MEWKKGDIGVMEEDKGGNKKRKKDHKRQFLPNVLSNGTVFLIDILIGIWFTPYLVRNLGVASFGLVPLAQSLTSYLNLIRLSLNSAAGRFLTIELEDKDVNAANITFNSVLFGNGGLVLFTLPLVIAFVFISTDIFNIPQGQEQSARVLFAATLISYLIMFIRSSFSISSWAKNRFDLRNIVIATDRMLRIGTVVLLFSLVNPRLIHVGAGTFLAALVGMTGDVFLWRKLTPQLRIQISNFKLAKIRKLLDMGGWLVVDQVGGLLFLNIDLILANVLLGVEIGGGYGTIILFPNTLRRLAQTISSVLTPTILAKYAQKEMDIVKGISKRAVRLMGLAMALPIGLLCGLGKPFLYLWLGPAFQRYFGLLVLTTAHLIINLSVFPLFGLNIALNKVRLPGIMTFGMGVINVLSAVFFVRMGWGALGIAAAGAITLTLKNAFFTPIYAALIQRLSWFTYIKDMIPGILATLLIGLGAYSLTHIIQINSWLPLIGLGVAIGLIYIIGIYVFQSKDVHFMIDLIRSSF